MCNEDLLKPWWRVPGGWREAGPTSSLQLMMRQDLGKLRSIARSPCRAALHEQPSISHPLLKLVWNWVFYFLFLPRVRYSEVTPVPTQDPSAPNPRHFRATVPGMPISASHKALPPPRKDKYQPLLPRFSIAQGYNGLSSGHIKWCLTTMSSPCAYSTTASYKGFLMTHAVSRNRVIAT